MKLQSQSWVLHEDFLFFEIMALLRDSSTSSVSIEGAEWQLTSADLNKQCREERLLWKDAFVFPYSSMKPVV